MLSLLESVKERAPARLVLDGGLVLSRGLRELKPRRVDYAKLVATLIMQTARTGSLRGPVEAFAFLPAQESRIDLAPRLLGELAALELAHPLLPSLLDVFARPRDEGVRTVVAVCGEAASFETTAHERLARSLAAHNRALELRVGRAVAAAAKQSERYISRANASSFRHIVVEEKPGKASILHLEEPSLKQVARRWQPLLTKKPEDLNRQPSDCSEGWGAAALCLSSSHAPLMKGHAHQSQRSVLISSFDMRLPGHDFTLESASILVEATRLWLQKLGLSFEALTSMHYSVPYPIVTGHLMQVFAAAGVRTALDQKSRQPRQAVLDEQFPEYVWGWQPLLSLLEFIAGAPSPALFVHTGSFPLVHVVAVHG